MKIQDILKVLTEYGTNLRQALNDPQADVDLTITVVSIAVIALVLFLLSLFTIYSLLSKKQRKRQQFLADLEYFSEKTETQKKKRTFRLAYVIILSAILLVAFISAPGILGNRLCTACHTHKKEIASHKGSTHKNISCLRCHQKPGISGFFSDSLDMLRMALVFVSSEPEEPIEGRVDNAACLRCHKQVSAKTVVSKNLKVRHKDFMDTKCENCHESVGHKKERIATTRMALCLPCHASKRVSTECSFCHKREAAYKKASDFTARLVKNPDRLVPPCGICHEGETEQSCMDCHGGIEMPHPPGWEEGGHARDAFVRKESCLRCHTIGKTRMAFHQYPLEAGAFCNRCHDFPAPHHANFIRTHGTEARTGITRLTFDCSKCHAGATYSCTVCHRENFCKLCH